MDNTLDTKITEMHKYRNELLEQSRYEVNPNRWDEAMTKALQRYKLERVYTQTMTEGDGIADKWAILYTVSEAERYRFQSCYDEADADNQIQRFLDTGEIMLYVPGFSAELVPTEVVHVMKIEMTKSAHKTFEYVEKPITEAENPLPSEGK